jgi:two-component system NtrC family sensor kinase
MYRAMFQSTQSTTSINLRQRFLLAARASVLCVIAISLLVLIGWITHIEHLKRIAPTLVVMNPLTAISLLSGGVAISLSLREFSTSKSRIAILVISILVVLIGLSRLLAVFTQFDPGWDQQLFPSTLYGNRIAPNSASCLVLIGLAILLIDIELPGKIRPAQILALISGGVALVALIGYAYSMQSLYLMPSSIAMALHTAICCILLSIAILFARPDTGVMAVVTGDDLGGLLARRLLTMTIAAPILLGWLRLVLVKHGRISDQLSNALLVMCIVTLFSLLVWFNARLFRRTDNHRRTAERIMQQAEERYRAVVQQTNEGIYLLDASSKRVVESNAAFQQLLGYTAAEAVQLTAYDIVHHTPENIDHRIAEILERGRAVMGERQYKRRDGSPVDVQANATVITYDGQAVLCTVVHDITRRKKNEREIQQKNQQLEETLAELKRTQSQLVQTEKLAGLGQMVAGVAHEINNPLSFVGNNVAVLQRDLAAIRKLLEMYQQADPIVEAGNKSLMEEIRELAERIDLAYTLKNSDEMMVRSRDGLRRIQQIVKDLREFARLDESDLQEANLNDGIESTANIIRGTAKKHQVEIELNLQPLPLFSCYPAKLNQVVMNLLSNAIDASKENSKVIVHTRSTPNDHVEIEVADRGTGIPPQIISRIFDPFYTTKPPGHGTGLGLSISYGIVQDHGGTIDVKSELGKGTSFTVRLPKRKAK